MREPNYYLGEGDFTKIGANVLAKASEIKGDYLAAIDDYIRSLNRTDRTGMQLNVPGGRPADKIIADGFTSGFSDCCHVLLALARSKKIPGAFVETIEIHKGECIIMRPFVEAYEGMDWKPRNPGYGKVEKDGELYILESNALPGMHKRRFVEVARGLDLSQLKDIEGNALNLRHQKPEALLRSKSYKNLFSKYKDFTPPPLPA
jgi:hypothetical protein